VLDRRALVFVCLTAVLLLAARPALAQPDPRLVPPRLISDPTVLYPEGGAGDATVVLTLLIDATGAVRSVIADRPNQPFSSAAEERAKSWRFEPATRDGQPVPARIRIEVAFREPEPEPERVPGGTPETAETGTELADPEEPEPQGFEVVVRGKRAEPGRTASLSRAEVRQIPGAFGDPFRAIEALPGVTPIVSGLPFFFIRGAPPGNVGYFLDGVRVPLLFHVGIGPSVVHHGLRSANPLSGERVRDRARPEWQQRVRHDLRSHRGRRFVRMLEEEARCSWISFDPTRRQI
jgi:TonB family protein